MGTRRKASGYRARLGLTQPRVATALVAALILLVSTAQGQVATPPGIVAEEIPEDRANAEMKAVGDGLSLGQNNTSAPTKAEQYALEGPEPNQTYEVAARNLNLDPMDLPVLPPGAEDGISVPSDSAPSPLFGAQPFTQQMLRFEEFGPVPMGPEGSVAYGDPFPAPPDAVSGPDPTALDDFFGQYVTPTRALPAPYPTRMANDPDNGGTDENPWKAEIEAFLGRPLVTPPAEGRPPGEDWAHQRYQEFYPEVYFYTAQAGARENTGLRDSLQLHRYNAGEFGPGGLYYNTTGTPGSEATTDGIEVQFHPDLPVQDPLALWTFDGTFPPKLLQARYGEPIMLRHYNALPIDPSANFGFGLHTLSSHEHNGHNPAESDGYTQAFFFPGQFYDYHWPMVIAGHDSINTGANDERAGAPDGSGGIKKLQGDWRETMSTHWFHDHMLDFTAQNVYKGNAAMMNYYSSLDRGNEAIDDEVNLRLPSGTALDWGNRDYDVNLLIADKAWDAQGQLFFNIFNLDGWLGDQLLTNWLWKPYFEVRARRYRLRILNGAVSRYMRLALVEQVNGPGGELAGPPGSGLSYNRVPFYMIANDGNILEHAVYFDGNTTVGGLTNRKGILPTQGIAERYDIIVDFGQFAPDTKLHLVNLLEHADGRGPKGEIPLADVLDGSYAPEIANGRNVTDPAVTAFLEFRVQPYAGIDQSMDPADYVAGGKKMIPLPVFTQEEYDNAIHRDFEFKRSNGTDSAPWTIKTDGGSGFNMDPRRLSAATTDARVEVWHLSGSGGWSHPIHVHFEEGQILKRGGVDPPEWEKWARKDIYRLGGSDDSSFSVDLVIRFREFLGSYMEHCHNTQHEDHAMLLRWDIENPGQVKMMPTPMPSWDGVGYVPTYALPTYKTGECGGGAVGLAADTPTDIPDDGGGLASGIVSTIAVANSFPVTDVNVGLNIDHSWIGDITATLSHGGTTVTIFDRPGVPTTSFGCSGNDVEIILDDEGTGGPVEEACESNLKSPPNYVPNEALSAFDGMDAFGPWMLVVYDSFATDSGTLESWSLDIKEDGSACGAATCVAEEAVGSAVPGLPVPDGGGVANPAVDTIVMADSFPISSVHVGLDLDTSWIGDVAATLSHGGVDVVLIDRPGVPASQYGCNADNIDIDLQDGSAGGPIESQCQNNLSSPPSYDPQEALSAFVGLDSAGPWTLTVEDHFGSDPTTLAAWSVHLAGSCGGACVPDCGGGRNCGGDGCGGSCGTCTAGNVCQESTGICEACAAGGPAGGAASPGLAFSGPPVSHTITVGTSFPVADVNASLSLTHSWAGDVTVTLSHGGTSVNLVDRPGVPASTYGCSSNNMAIELDDQGLGGPIEAQCQQDLASPPAFTPNGALSAFNGMDAAGDWTITVSDAYAGADPGVLDGWSLSIERENACP